ncbi:hypothetical protein FGW20_05635 [Methanoculleus sp. FWC-SCC3]|uniref:Polymerase nucleotidyl transferase domain-containing protein n=2 Tax=Methanoculleus methanifontis TaxID=2584086 RepID=A0ABT8M0I9_9EURY|nr:hypothetical protein [Methanoculleus sp. FWC-SCC3]
MREYQHMLNVTQQRGNPTWRHPHNKTPEPTPAGNLHPWDFLDGYNSLFRKSSLILLVVLGRAYTNKFHVRELSRMVERDVSLVSKNLKDLEAMGLVTREDVGNLAFYQARMESVLLRQTKIWFTLLELQPLVRDLQEVTTSAVLYGSCARGEDTSASDIDLYIETAEKEPVREVLERHRAALSRELSPVVHTADETYRLKTEDAPFFDSIRQGIVLSG